MKSVKRAVILVIAFAAAAVLLCATAFAEGVLGLDGFPGLDKSELYYRSALEGKMLWLFDTVVDTALRNEQQIDLSSSEYSFTFGEAKNVVNAVMKEYFGDRIYSAYYSYYNDSDIVDNRTCAAITLRLNLSYQGEYLTQLRDSAEEILGKAGITGDNVSSLSALEKAFRIHDALVDHIVYEIASGTELGARRDQTAYSALAEGRTVCAGYGRAFQLLMGECGVETLYVTGEALNSSNNRENHGWNLVKEDEGWYNFDVTWDDTGRTYNYFNVSEATLSVNHFREDFFLGYPATPDNDGWNPAKDEAYNSIILQSDTDDWYVSGVYDMTKGFFYEDNKDGFSVPRGSSLQIMINYGPGCSMGEGMKVYENGEECEFTDCGFYFYVLVPSCRKNLEISVEGINKPENAVYGSVSLTENDGTLSGSIVSLPKGATSYYAMMVLDGNISAPYYGLALNLSDLEYGQTVQLYVWVEGYSGYLKSEDYVVTQRSIRLASDCVLGVNEVGGRYEFHFNSKPDEPPLIWVGVYDGDGRFMEALIVDGAEDFSVGNDCSELRFFSVRLDESSFRPVSASTSVPMQEQN